MKSHAPTVARMAQVIDLAKLSAFAAGDWKSSAETAPSSRGPTPPACLTPTPRNTPPGGSHAEGSLSRLLRLTDCDPEEDGAKLEAPVGVRGKGFE